MCYQHDIFYSHSDIFFRDVDAGLDCEHHSLLQLQRNPAPIVNINPDEMAEAMREVFTERLAVFVLAM